MKMHCFGLALCLLFAGATCVFGQAPGEKEFTDYAQGVKNKSLTDPSLTSAGRLPKLQANVTATRTDTDAAIEIGLNSVKTAASEFQLGFKVSGPVKKGEEETNLATLEGLSNKTKLSLNLHWTYPRPEVRFFNKDVFIQKLSEKYQETHSKEEYERAKDSLELADLKTDEDRTAVLAAIGLGHGIWHFGAEGTYATPETFHYLLPDTLTSAAERHNGYALAATLGWLPLGRIRQYYVGATYRREESYSPQDSQQLCTPYGVGSALTCSNVIIGAPNQQVKDLGQLETRMYFHEGQLAINPRITRDFANKVTGADLPIYFLKDGNGVLNGGLSVGWRSDTKSYTLSAFIGTAMTNPFQ